MYGSFSQFTEVGAEIKSLVGEWKQLSVRSASAWTSRLNLIRYHGVLAPSARDRSKIVPADPPPDAYPADQQVPLSPQQRAHRLAWAVLLARVFAIDVSQSPPHVAAPCAWSPP